jgi:hypothetical protein
MMLYLLSPTMSMNKMVTSLWDVARLPSAPGSGFSFVRVPKRVHALSALTDNVHEQDGDVLVGCRQASERTGRCIAGADHVLQDMAREHLRTHVNVSNVSNTHTVTTGFSHNVEASSS